MIHRVKTTHPLDNWGVNFDDHVFRVFRNGWIDYRDAFRIFLCL